MSRIRTILATLSLAFALGAGSATAEYRIGLATTLTGNAALLGQQMRDGAQAAVDTFTDGPVRLTVADDLCTAEGGAAAARRFLAARVEIVVGFLCTEAIEAALPILSDAGVPVLTPAVRTDGLTDRRTRTGWLVFRMAPRADAERAAIAGELTRRWRTALFAVVDDGTIYGREIAESFRLAAEQAALEPVFVDTFRPQLDNQIGLVGRLRRSGATHVLAGGDREDIAVMARDAAGLDYPLVIAGGEALRAAPGEVPLAAGTLMVGLPEWAELADEGVVEAFRAAGAEPDGYVLPTYAAMEVAVAALGRAGTSGTPLPGVLSGTTFTTAIGEIGFDERGDLAANPYRLFRFDGNRFVEVD